MNLSRTAKIVLWGFMGFGLSFIYVPLMLVVINSFNKNKSFNWPPTGFTTMWWSKAASNPGVKDAIILSVLTATLATIIALILGSLAAAAIARYNFFGRDVISLMFVLPIALPGIVTGIALNVLSLSLTTLQRAIAAWVHRLKKRVWILVQTDLQHLD